MVSRQNRAKKFDKNIKKSLELPEKLTNRVGAFFLKEKLLSKPKAKLPSYSAVKAIKGIADEAQPLVREVEERKFEEPRSLFFKEEFNKERRSASWI